MCEIRMREWAQAAKRHPFAGSVLALLAHDSKHAMVPVCDPCALPPFPAFPAAGHIVTTSSMVCLIWFHPAEPTS